MLFTPKVWHWLCIALYVLCHWFEYGLILIFVQVIFFLCRIGTQRTKVRAALSWEHMKDVLEGWFIQLTLYLIAWIYCVSVTRETRTMTPMEAKLLTVLLYWMYLKNLGTTCHLKHFHPANVSGDIFETNCCFKP